MTKPIDVPPRPPEATVPTYRYWGDRKPPKNRADFFSYGTAPKNAAGDTTSSSSTPATVATLRMYGPIDQYGGWWGISAKDVAKALDELGDVDEIRVRINSPGGDAWEGMAILNMLRAHPAKVTAVVDGLAASAASYIAAGCDETVMSPGTQLMIHDASTFAYGPADLMRKAATFLDSLSNSIASIYAEVAGGNDADWRALMVETTWYTAAEAVDAGLADRVAVVPDGGETDTAGEDMPDPTEEEIDPEVEDRFDLSMYPHAGRSHAPAPKPPTASAGGSTETEGGSAVAFSDEQLTTMRETLGLAETADEAAILAAVNAVVEESLEERSEGRAPGAPTATAAVPEGMTLIETEVLDQIRTAGQQGVEARQQQLTEARDQAINAAIAAGKTTPARREHWVKSWTADPEGTKALLEALEPGLVPLDELGHGDQAEAEASIDDAPLEAWSSQLGLTKEALRG